MSQGSPPIQALKAFWKEYYKTSNIRLSVVGSSSLDALQRVVEDSFGELPISNEPPRRKKVNPNSLVFPLENAVYNPQEPAFGKEQLGKIREVIPILESRLLKVQFATPPMEDPVLRKTKPHRVVSHLLGHESPGSLHCLMNEMGLITGLTSGASIDTSEFSLFGMTLSLTPKGMKEKELVLDLVFQWIGLIKDTAIKEPDLLAAYHNELSQISANGFKFRENGDPTDFCSSASELLFDDDHPAEILASGSLVDDYDPVVAKSFLERLSPDNAMVTLVDSSTKPDESDGWKVEPLYGANYREQNMSDEQLRQWGSSDGKFNPKLHLPALNEYIPSDFSLRCDDTEEGRKMSNSERDEYRKEDPILLKQGPNFRLWHKMDRFWRVPKAFIRLSIVSPNTYCSPRSMTLSRIYQRVLNDDLNSFVYDASLAGCNYR
jgi:insulysin